MTFIAPKLCDEVDSSVHAECDPISYIEFLPKGQLRGYLLITWQYRKKMAEISPLLYLTLHFRFPTYVKLKLSKLTQYSAFDVKVDSKF